MSKPMEQIMIVDIVLEEVHDTTTSEVLKICAKKIEYLIDLCNIVILGFHMTSSKP